MEYTLTAKMYTEQGWLYEIKRDGSSYRMASYFDALAIIANEIRQDDEVTEDGCNPVGAFEFLRYVAQTFSKKRYKP